MLMATAGSGVCSLSCPLPGGGALGRTGSGSPSTSGGHNCNGNGSFSADNFVLGASSTPSSARLLWSSSPSSSSRRRGNSHKRMNLRRVSLGAARATANAEKIETPAPAPAPSAETEQAKLDRRAADWKKAEKLKETGAVHKGRVDSCNSGGLLVRINTLQGFLPFSQLNGARIPKDGSKTINEIGNELVGAFVSVKVIECVEAERRLIVSEKQAVLVDIIQKLKEGDIYEGKVNFVTDYGAFVDLKFPDGSYPVSGLVHVTELSWDPVPFPQDFIAQGQEVTVKVIQVDREKPKIALSIKQLQADPLLETLDTLMPSQDDASNTEVELGASLPGLEQICEYMLQEEGITGVTLGRQALEKRVVSQDLELWLSNATVEDGKFTLLARAGRQVQEVYLNTSLDREGIKAAVQRVTGRVP
ncbi:unnamed protein product [Calypogeia fissa]